MLTLKRGALAKIGEGSRAVELSEGWKRGILNIGTGYKRNAFYTISIH